MRPLRRPAVVALAAWLLVPAGPGGAAGRSDYRSIDGSGNHPQEPLRGAAGAALLRLAPADYADRTAAPSGTGRPGAREISNAVAAESGAKPGSVGVSDLFWVWGQFLDHDLDLTVAHAPAEPFDISVPAGDEHFDPAAAGDRWIRLNRSRYDPSTGVRRGDPRRQLNEVTAWIDGSQIYGSSPERANALRRWDGSGGLRTSRGRLLPFNEAGLPNAPTPSPDFFLAGDVRANENVALTAMHVLWVREHQRQARRIRRDHPRLGGDEIYERARARVGALLQVITYREFLPLLLGSGAISEYRGWDPSVEAGVTIEFSTAAFRFGHSLVSPALRRLDTEGERTAGGPLLLERAFFAPGALRPATGIEPLLRGLASQRARPIDPRIADGLRNFLFGPPGAGGFDLASLNIQRGRDHGIPSWLRVRAALGLPPVRDFAEVTSDGTIAAALRATYGGVENVDLWVGGLAEDPVPGAMVGPTFHAIIVDQFTRLRDGDRFFYRRNFRGREIQRLEATRLADVIRRNTRIGGEIGDDVLLASELGVASAATGSPDRGREVGPRR